MESFMGFEMKEIWKVYRDDIIPIGNYEVWRV